MTTATLPPPETAIASNLAPISTPAAVPAPAAKIPPAPSDPLPRRIVLRRLAAGILALAALAVAASVGAHWWTVGRFIESTDDAYVGADITVIAPQVAGTITAVAVTDNQAVRAGDVLVTIDDREFKAALDKAYAAVAGQIAAQADLAANRHLQDAYIHQAQADIDAAAALLAKTTDDRERYRQLAAHQVATVQEAQKAENDYQQAVAAGARASAAMEAAGRRLEVLDAQSQQIAANLASAQADRERARIDLDRTVLRAPIDGTVGNRAAQTGAYAAVGAALVSLVPARGLWVDANFKENALARLHPGQTVTIRADVLPGEVFTGHVVSLAPATGAQFSILPAENATGNFTKIVQRVPVRIALDGEGALLGRLRPGLSVEADIDSRSGDETGKAIQP